MLASPLAFPRVGIVVPRHQQSAVDRNRLKRRLRELVRLELLPSLRERPAVDLAIRARREAYSAAVDGLRSGRDRRFEPASPTAADPDVELFMRTRSRSVRARLPGGALAAASRLVPLLSKLLRVRHRGASSATARCVVAGLPCGGSRAVIRSGLAATTRFPSDLI